MKKALLILLLAHTGCSTFCQGSWNIGYIEVASIATSHIGETVKIDFKHSNADKKRTAMGVRSYITPQDSAIISLDSREFKVIEKRKIYVDHGSFNDQYLEIVDQDNLLVKRIYDTKLIEIAGDRLKFLVSIDSYDKYSNGHDGKINSEVKEFWINKRDLDGLMIKN
jgi:hypothetical protein